MKTGKTFIISGPSGVGKSTVLRELLRDRDDLYFSISATTRTPREGEINGVHYHFINVDRFREMIQEDEFLEYAEYVGDFYGTPKRYVDEAMAQGKDVILDIEVQGALQVIGKRPDTVRIFIAPPSWDALEQRLTGRALSAPRSSFRPPTPTITLSSTTRWKMPCARSTPSCSPSIAARASAWRYCSKIPNLIYQSWSVRNSYRLFLWRKKCRNN